MLKKVSGQRHVPRETGPALEINRPTFILPGSDGCIRDKRSGSKIDGKQGYFQQYQYIEKKSV